MFFLLFLKKKLKGTKIDKFLRIFFNLIIPIYLKSSKNFKIINNTKFIFICYGGLGDCVLSLPFLNKLAQIYNVTVFIEQKFIDLQLLLPKNVKVISYLKDQLLLELKRYGKNNENFILIQQSPILEFALFHFLLKKPPIIGFIFSQENLFFTSLKISKKMKSLNKILKYNAIYKLILELNNKNQIKKYLHNFYKIKDNKFNKYYILSPTKNPDWKMGFLEFKAYANFIIEMFEKVKIMPMIIGTKDDFLIIEEILKNIPKHIEIYNMVGKTELKQLFTLVKHSEFVVANDNGIHHLSNFLNKRTLTLFNFSNSKVFKWNNKNSNYLFNPKYKCMPCVGNQIGPFDNYPFECPWKLRCKDTINENQIIQKLVALNWIN